MEVSLFSFQMSAMQFWNVSIANVSYGALKKGINSVQSNLMQVSSSLYK